MTLSLEKTGYISDDSGNVGDFFLGSKSFEQIFFLCDGTLILIVKKDFLYYKDYSFPQSDETAKSDLTVLESPVT